MDNGKQRGFSMQFYASVGMSSKGFGLKNAMFRIYGHTRGVALSPPKPTEHATSRRLIVEEKSWLIPFIVHDTRGKCVGSQTSI